MKGTIHISFMVGLALSVSNTSAQNLDKIGSDDAVKVSGALTFNTITYAQRGLITPSRDPFTWYASGNVNISILDVALPFTYTYSNQSGKFTQPFNRTSFNPSYKWAKANIGITSTNFSTYTLTGHLFLGAGLELTPGNWKIQLMSGRLNKAIPYSSLEDNLNEIVYRRFGYGLKVGYELKGYGGAITIFKAKDDKNSLPFIPLNSPVNPQDNLVMSISGKAKLTTALYIDAEYALSGLTQNTFAINEMSSSAQRLFYPLIDGNETTEYFKAYKASLKYNLKFMSVALKYEHIDPGYKTLGGYYFNNDLENYTIAPTFNLLKKKLMVALNTGYQRNNLSEEKSATTSRWVGSINASFVPNKRIVFTGNYSNFSTFTKNRPTTDPFYYAGADTMNFYQLSQTGSGMVAYNFGTDSVKSNVQLLYTYQVATNLTGDIQTAGAFGTNVSPGLVGIPAKTHMGNLSYTCQSVALKGAITTAANVNRTIINDQLSTFFGPTLNLQKSIWGKLGSISIGSTYNRQYQNSTLISNILNHRIGFSVNPTLKNEKIGKVSVSANANWMQRFAVSSSSSNISEVNLFINLNYSI